MPANLRGLIEDAVGHDLVVVADLGDEPAEDDAVDHAEGMIGDDDLRAAGGQRADTAAGEFHIQAQCRRSIAPEEFGRPAQFRIALVEAADARLAGDLLDAANDALAEAAYFVGGIRE